MLSGQFEQAPKPIHAHVAPLGSVNNANANANAFNPYQPHKCLPSQHSLWTFLSTTLEPGRLYYSENQLIEYFVGNIPLVITVPHGGHELHQLRSMPTETTTRDLGQDEQSMPSASESQSRYQTTQELMQQFGVQLPLRQSGCIESDIGTAELGREMIKIMQEQNYAIQDRDSVAKSSFIPLPHVIICRAARTYVDQNRNRENASDNEQGRRLWDIYHRCIFYAIHASIPTSKLIEALCPNSTPNATGTEQVHVSTVLKLKIPEVFCVDLHGQSHDERSQIGYLLKDNDLENLLQLSSNETDGITTIETQTELINKCSLCDLYNSSLLYEKPPRFPSFLYSFGASLEQRGYPCVPSPSNPTCGKDIMYFNGGYCTLQYGSSQRARDLRELDWENIETEYPNLKVNEFPDAFVEAKLKSLWNHSASPLLHVNAWQCETSYLNVRDTQTSCHKFAIAFIESIVEFLSTHSMQMKHVFRDEHLQQ